MLLPILIPVYVITNLDASICYYWSEDFIINFDVDICHYCIINNMLLLPFMQYNVVIDVTTVMYTSIR